MSTVVTEAPLRCHGALVVLSPGGPEQSAQPPDNKGTNGFKSGNRQAGDAAGTFRRNGPEVGEEAATGENDDAMAVRLR